MIRLTEQSIRNLYSETVFKRGRSYYLNGSVRNLAYASELNSWHANVMGSRLYETLVALHEDHVASLCNCPAFRSYGSCKHICATLLAIADEQRTSSGHSRNSGTKKARYRQAQELIGHFSSDAYDDGLAGKRLLKMEFLLRTYAEKRPFIDKEVFYIQLKVGESRLYVVKEIREFLACIAEGKEMEFGKHFTFDPGSYIFSEQDREVIEKLMEIVRTETFYDKNRDYGTSSSRTGKELLIPLYAADELLLKLQHLNCKYEQQHMVYEHLELVMDHLPFAFALEPGRATDEFQLKISGSADGQYYEKYGWYADKEKLYKVSAAQQHALQPLGPYIGKEAKPAIPLSKEQMGAFISNALPKIKQIGEVAVSGKVSDVVVSPPLKVKLFIDGSEERVDVRLEYHYDSIIVNPLIENADSDRSSRTILIRNAEQEQGFMDILETAPLRVSGSGLYCETEENLFEFLYETLPQLEEHAEIYLTPTVKSMILPAAAKAAVEVNIQSDGNFLEVDFTMDGIAPQEVAQILQSVVEKKRYIRLPDGAFLSLADKELQEIADLHGELSGDSVKGTDGRLQLPLYRGMQLEERLIRLDKRSKKFGKNFRQFLASIRSPEEGETRIPATLQADLRDYQETGFKWLKSLSKHGLGGILADDMGLGKTLQCIAYILSEMEGKADKPFLIVAPASLVYNWKNEFQKFAPSVRVAVAVGTAPERRIILERSGQTDVYITSYHTLRQDLSWYSEQEFHALILDEAQAIKNYTSKIAQAVRKVPASRRFALSGTPVENSLDELWSVFQAVMPDLLYNQKTFRSLPPETIARLVRPFIMRRLKQDVLTELPDKIETVHYSELNREQKKLYLAYLEKIRAETEESLAEGLGKDRLKILAGLTRLRQLCCHPSLFIEEYEGGSGKLEALFEIIETVQENGRRMLIFSQFPSMLKIIEKKLEASERSCFYLDGQTPAAERVRLVDAFNQGAEAIFLISLKAGGTGLNLTGADTVILYDLWWNPAIEEQAIGRAHRMGQKNVVQVIRLIAQGTIEEKINELQQRKKEMIDQIIQPGEAMLSAMSEEDIREILSI